MTDETRPEEFRNKTPKDYSHIKGWGIARDTENDPTYPMKNRKPEDNQGYTWRRPPLQPMDIEVLKSVERKNYPAVFGNTLPPSGLSGVIRRAAFKKSESSFGRWVPLILADRINMVEGIVDDLRTGTFPNFFKERGWTAEWKYNRQEFVIKSAVAFAVGAGLLGAFLWSSKEKSKAKHLR